jgi:ATP-binding cassette subfamily B protein
LVAFYQYLGFISWPLRNVGWILTLAQEADAAGKRVFEILDARPEIRDAKGATALDRVDGLVELDDVHFTYPGSTIPALDGVSLRIEPGEIVALVGASGSGKSTVAALLSRFYDPQSGEVRLDGHPLPTVTLHSLRSAVGVVFDEAVLFSASVRENITFGHADATDEQVHRAAHVAGVDVFLDDLPDGIDTRVGEQGYGLSGGQRQRLALARALVTSPRVLVLDDPLSAVDARTEATIEAHLARVMRGRTTVLIAHRASTVAMADRVLVLEGGRIVAEGTHTDLLAKDARYRSLLAEELDTGTHTVLEAVQP